MPFLANSSVAVRNAYVLNSVSSPFCPPTYVSWHLGLGLCSLSLLELYCQDVQSGSESWHHLLQSSCSGGSALALGAQAVNNDTNLGLCWAAMVQFIFWREYLNSADKQEGAHGSPRVSLDLCARIGCHVAMAMSPSAEHHVLGTGSSWSHAEREWGVQQLSFWTVSTSLRAVAQKLQWLCSFPRGFGSP
jgi:hypothetical protein